MLGVKCLVARGELIDGVYDAICTNEYLRHIELEMDFGFF